MTEPATKKAKTVGNGEEGDDWEHVEVAPQNGAASSSNAHVTLPAAIGTVRRSLKDMLIDYCNFDGHTGHGDWPAPVPPTHSQNWHADVTNDLRNHLVGKLVKAAFVTEATIEEAFDWARNEEKNLFEKADDREQYYHLLAEKIYQKKEGLTDERIKELQAAVPRPAQSERVFEVAEMRIHLDPVLNQLNENDDAIPFKFPVDPHALNIPDYFDVVKRPMDLNTISEKLRGGSYSNPWQFCDDFWLMFDNCWLYNKKNSKVYCKALRLSALFIKLIDPAMAAMGYCCGQKRSFTPRALFCHGAPRCPIERDQTYYCYETTSTTSGVTERYCYCPKCFEILPHEGISLSENDESRMAPKGDFKLFKNNVIEAEPFENCKFCHRKWHKICALHNEEVFPEGFMCKTCRLENQMPLPENKFLAKKLAPCKLSTHLEDRVNGFIKNKLKGAGNHEVIIRVLSAVEKEVEVKPTMKSKYCGNSPSSFPQKFPYKSKAIFAFEVIDGVEVCFFGMYAQEYGSDCPAPNKGRVYISFLDSVHYFQPKKLRTDVYHEILLGYLDYARQLGYTHAHLWARPQNDGEDFIFNCHPKEQKIPHPKRLINWTMRMLDKGLQEGCVVQYKNIYKQAKDDGLISPTELPYFEGDFWPGVIEDYLRDIDNEDRIRPGTKTARTVTDMLLANLEKHREAFFIVRLANKQTAGIVDPDPLKASDLMDGRDSFLTRCREKRWEFSSLRHAKYSTLCMAYELHKEKGTFYEVQDDELEPSTSRASASSEIPLTHHKSDNERILEALAKIAAGQERTNELLEKIANAK